MIFPNYFPWVAAFSRPVLLTVAVRGLRLNMVRIAQVMLDTLPMVVLIISYIIYFSSMGARLYLGTPEGV